ncbi:putative Ovate family protein 13 [Tripterygium wilfordii]|uniref:Transcription repressor n=1 Tax=Tripterygium wilfordii TaxID=458696 RepID=A0A7J7DWM6_TRIWF|nr:transcription repressor OFP13-like [Tripterygium wilfordii]KAF5750564.1 putative Ovate family protein 13 [Tripterygium wilfordii]
MVKKMKLSFLSKAWPSCNQPRTLSFREFKTINSAYVVDAVDTTTTTTHDYSILSTNSLESPSFSTLMSEDSGGDCSIERMIQGLRSERLFFEPGESNSILEESKSGGFPFKQSLVMSMESEDPYVDFRKSMEEMVEAHGVKDWEGLEELFCWYLRVNGKNNHGYIVGAFVDLLVSICIHDFSRAHNYVNVVSSSPSSPLSFCTSSCDDGSSSSLTPCISSMEAESTSQNREKDDDGVSS